MTEELSLIKVLVDLGGTVVVSVLLIFGLYKLLSRFGCAFITAQEKMAEAMADQAKSTSGMRDAIQNFIQKDNNEHREILLGLQVVGEELKCLTTEVRFLRELRK